MYKAAGQFMNRLNSGGRNRRFNTKLTSTADLQTIAPAKTTEKRKIHTNNGNRVYLVKFKSKHYPDIEFVKIGVSTKPIPVRFGCDANRYVFEVLAMSPVMSGYDAYALEQALHKTFFTRRYTPTLRLKSGNSECYAHTEENIRCFVNLVNNL